MFKNEKVITEGGVFEYLGSHIETLKDRIELGDPRARLYEEQIVFFEKTKEMAEKQIPERPREHYNWCDFSDDEKKENNQWFCLICGREVEESQNYCTECGQAINWD